jgi:HEAT repeat protein
MIFPNLMVMRATCLSLTAIGNRNALEAVALLLLQGNNEMRKAAAEALANHVEEGHPTLRDGCTIDDPLTRWAVVFGLMRIRQPWVRQILENLQIHDGEWVVRNAAEQALEELSRPMIHGIDTSIPLSETPWLIEFASEKGIGISPGKSALELLHLALKEGTDEQRLGALYQLQYRGDNNSVPYILNILNEKKGELREVAFQVIWHLDRSGIVMS